MTPIPLYERYRPRTLDDVLGQPKAVGIVRRILERGGFGGRAVWLSGPSGMGKSSLAKIIAGTLADPSMVEETDARSLGAADLARWRDSSTLYGWGKGGRAYIVNESHGLRGPLIEPLLEWLESLRPHVVVIFTTTNEGQDRLFEDQIDAGPLLSRCLPIRLTNQGVQEPFADRLESVAVAEGLNGCPDAAKRARRILKDCKGNLRAAYQAVEAGALLAD